MLRPMLTLLAITVAAPATARIVTESVPYKHGDVALEGYLAYDDTFEAKRPAVIVVHEWWGLNDFAKQQARRLAKLGYVAFAVDMYGKGKVTEDPQQASQWARALYGNPAHWQQRAKAGYEIVAKHSRVDKTRIAAIGYCFGGSTVQQMAWSGLPIKGVVSFHGGLTLFCFSRNWRMPPFGLHLYGRTRRRFFRCRNSDGISVGPRRWPFCVSI